MKAVRLNCRAADQIDPRSRCAAGLPYPAPLLTLGARLKAVRACWAIVLTKRQSFPGDTMGCEDRSWAFGVPVASRIIALNLFPPRFGTTDRSHDARAIQQGLLQRLRLPSPRDNKLQQGELSL